MQLWFGALHYNYMLQDIPTVALVNLGIATYLFFLWFSDFKNFCKTKIIGEKSLEGATTTPIVLVFIAIFASIALLCVHTCTEISLGVVGEQTKVKFWALFSWIGAAFIEELIFRGYLVVKNKGSVMLWGSIFFFSLIFAIGHPFVWDYTIPENAQFWAGEWKFNFSAQTINATISVFECSLLFYVLRFLPLNENRSIIPCIVGHCTYNLGVFITKMCQGFVAW